MESASTEFCVTRWDRSIDHALKPLTELCRTALDEIADPSILDRLNSVIEPRLWLALVGERWIGFKLGYRHDDQSFVSFLGGVEPSFRNRGIASALMRKQHEDLRELGFRYVITRARSSNRSMLRLNLEHGFEINGFEVNARGIGMVLQRKALTAD